ADLSVDVGTLVRVLAVERDGVERGRQSLGGLTSGQHVEALVGLLGRAFAGEHPLRQFLVALEREDARRVRELSRHVLGEAPQQAIAVVAERRRRHAADLVVGERLGDERLLDPLTSYLIGEDFFSVLLQKRIPTTDNHCVFWRQSPPR